MNTMISIVLPVYNRISGLGNGILQLKTLLEQRAGTYEIIIVDDGSADRDPIMAIASQYHCRYLRNDPNAGKGMAVKRGTLAAEGNLIIFMDGDFPFQLSVIAEMIRALKEYPLVIGDRTLPASRYSKEAVLLRRVGSRILSSVINRYYVKGIRDSQCGIKGFQAATAKAIFNKITLNKFSFDVEVLYIASCNRLPIGRVPVQVNEQDGSSVNVFKDGLGMMFSLLRIKLNHVRGKYRINE